MSDSSSIFEIIHATVTTSDNQLSVSEMCKIAGVSRSGYYAWVKAAPIRAVREEQDRADFNLILIAYKKRGYSKGAKGIYTFASQIARGGKSLSCNSASKVARDFGRKSLLLRQVKFKLNFTFDLGFCLHRSEATPTCIKTSTRHCAKSLDSMLDFIEMFWYN